MGFDVLRRVRWGNVGRAAGAVALVAAVVAWPRLTTPPPQVPASGATPLVEPARGEGAAGPWRDATMGRRRDRRARRRPARPSARDGERRQVGRRRDRRARRRREAVVVPVPTRTPVVAPVPTRTPVAAPAPPTAPAPDPAETEFGFEGG